MTKDRTLVKIFSVVIFIFSLTAGYGEASPPKNGQDRLAPSLLDRLPWRSVGPANPGGRIDDLAVVESNPRIVYVATASGGVWKTVNNGVTWAPLFDNQNTSSIGDITIAPSNPDIVWVGTGEPNNRQSSSWGDGVYKSTDGGATWKNMGLRDTHHIGRIAIHPADPNIVYVAALGHLWGPNEERGLFKTTDGGLTWTNAKFIDEHTGFVDVVMDPGNPSILYAAAYQRQRKGWGFNGGGLGSGLYKTKDGGQTWELLKNGLPTGTTGRIGVTIFHGNPNIVYATVEHKDGGVFRSQDKGLSWTRMSSVNPRPMYYSKIRIDPNDDRRIWVLGEAMNISEDGGKTFRQETYRASNAMRMIHGDHHAMWINPADSNHMIVGSDGGIYFSYDRGQTWDFINSFPLAQIYEIGFDMRKPYFVYGGLQDNDCWGGPSATFRSLGITNADWFKIGGGDGINVQVDPTDYTNIYAVFSVGNIVRFDLKTGESKPIRPEPESENEKYRFNWNCPILISPHDQKVIYFGGNKLFRSPDRGETWEASVDLTAQPDRDRLPMMGAPTDENTLSRNDGITFYGTITSIAESPLKKGVLYVGTDDGNLQISRDEGRTWKNVAGKIPGAPEKALVSRVIASHFQEGTAYVTFDGHQNNDFKGYIYITTDFGESWQPIASNLIEGGPVHVIREHHRNPNLLFVGTEQGVYVSFDRGRTWARIKGNLPTVPVDDLAIHPRENDLILGTHGRGIWILDDISPLEQLTNETLNSPAHLFKIRDAMLFLPYDQMSTVGNRTFMAPNPPAGAVVRYFLRNKAEGGVIIVIENEKDETIRELKGPGEPGYNQIAWDLRYAAPSQSTIGEFGSYFRSQAPRVLPGRYQVRLSVLGQDMKELVNVVGDPRLDISFEERKAQHDALYSLYALSPLLSMMCKTSDDVWRQASAVEKTLGGLSRVPESLRQESRNVFKKLDEIQIELLGDPRLNWPGASASLRANLIQTGRRLEGYTGAPSPSQIRKIQLNSARLISLAKKLNQILGEDIPRFNRNMSQNNMSLRISADIIKISE